MRCGRAAAGLREGLVGQALAAVEEVQVGRPSPAQLLVLAPRALHAPNAEYQNLQERLLICCIRGGQLRRGDSLRPIHPVTHSSVRWKV